MGVTAKTQYWRGSPNCCDNVTGVGAPLLESSKGGTEAFLTQQFQDPHQCLLLGVTVEVTECHNNSGAAFQ